ncbi:MAG: hypothetical protein K1X57_07865 [Gemmataceae bacterium]|nr:hypothetical protein [Gemmataceae bacterium]
MGPLVRIIDGVFKARPEPLNTLTEMNERFFTYLVWRRGFVEPNDAKIVGSVTVPARLEAPLPMRIRHGLHGTENFHKWLLIYDGQEAQPIELSEESMKLSLYEFWSMPLLINRIQDGWRPEAEV